MSVSLSNLCRILVENLIAAGCVLIVRYARVSVVFSSQLGNK